MIPGTTKTLEHEQDFICFNKNDCSNIAEENAVQKSAITQAKAGIQSHKQLSPKLFPQHFAVAESSRLRERHGNSHTTTDTAIS